MSTFYTSVPENTEDRCHECGGYGWVYRNPETVRCDDCRGTGYAMTRTDQRAYIRERLECAVDALRDWGETQLAIDVALIAKGHFPVAAEQEQDAA